MDNTKIPKIDNTKLTPEQRNQLETYQQAEKQITALEDIASMMQELVNISDDSKEAKQLSALGAVLTDAREQLVALNKKEAPEQPDFAKPVVQAIAKLESALGKIQVKASDVNVAAPNVKVAAPDLAAFNKVLKTEIPKAFKEAIKLIPQVEIPKTDNSELLAAWAGISEQLVSIENATRMKPLPGSMAISNLGTVTEAITNTVASYAVQIDDYTTTNVTYIGKAPVGTATSTAGWQIQKIDETTGMVITWADGNSNFDNVWGATPTSGAVAGLSYS